MKKLLLLCSLAGYGIAGAANVPAPTTIASAEPTREAAPAAPHKAGKSAAKAAPAATQDKMARDGDATTTPTTTSDLSKIPLFQQAKPLGGYR